MGITPDDLARANAAAKQLESEGYFERARAGSQKAASLFARFVAFRLNPDGDESDFGCLSKASGEQQVDGFAEDAIVFSNDPSDLANVVDLVNGAGAADASIPDTYGVKPRRSHNRWIKPEALTQTQLLFLRPTGTEPKPKPPVTPQYPGYEELGGDEGGKVVTRQLARDFRAAGRPGLDDDCGAWQQRVSYDFLTRRIATVQESITKHRDGWLIALGLIRVEPGMQSVIHVCTICNRSASAPIGTPVPTITHAPECGR